MMEFRDTSSSTEPVLSPGKRRGGVLILVLLLMVPMALAGTRWYVNGVDGNDANNCKSPEKACKTISHAISLASSGDTIVVAAATYTENLTVDFSLTVFGADASTTIIDGGAANTVVTTSGTSTEVFLSKVTIRNGLAVNGAGINNAANLTIDNVAVTANSTSNGETHGAGIYNTGILTVNNSTLTDNTNDFSGGAIYNSGTLTINKSTVARNSAPYGGGCVNSGALTINDSTFSGNTAPVDEAGSGGGIFNAGSLTVNNSTFVGNTAGNAGGIDGGTQTVTISNSTIAGNSANQFSGGGIATIGKMILQNSIVANNSGGNCEGTMTSNGYNLSSDTSCNFNGPGDLNNTDPDLGRLRNNGGPTQTMALPPESPALDAGNPNGCTDGNGNLLKTDQRGEPRPGPHDHHGCDMGAFENQNH
jgi:hypothetical protein